MTLDALNESAANPTEGTRDPFRFYVRLVTVPAAAAMGLHEQPTAPAPAPSGLDAQSGPPMAWKLTAVVQRDRTRWAVFSDCRGIPATVREGELLAGAWRVTRIGIESVTLQSLDDRATTLPLVGCQTR